ncbi:MAG: DNA mismatch repair endonuclease MutL [Lachnospiraceae bacterium]|nr:DNA mismatch repair endonuclease MutL [Lachnospiraceae bacterium]
MGNIIHVLDDKTIDRIAAGEVVERPMNVVKELVENAIDAGATAVTVEIKEGGISYIRVTDNGQGIRKDQVRTAFMRHATSKINDAADLFNIHSLGFRGEALSSIAAVSQVELFTKTEDELTGIRYCIEGSRETVFDEAGVPTGTTFIVRNLFYNTPARRKFLKTPQTEGTYIAEYMEKALLSNSGIAFKLMINGNVKLQSYKTGKTADSLYSLFGKDVLENMIPFNAANEDVKITGYVGKPVLCRSNRNLEIYFVNKRYIKSTLIQRALDEAYKPYLMLHRFPFVLLYFDIPPELIDVNVHPSKMEIRFINSGELYEFLVTSIREVLKKQEMIPRIGEEEAPPAISDAIPEPFETGAKEQLRKEAQPGWEKQDQREDYNKREEYNRGEEYNRKEEQLREKDPGYDTEKYADINTFPEDQKQGASAPAADPVMKEFEGLDNFEQESLLDKEAFLTPDARKRHRLIGRLFDTYILVEYENELYMIDQHAAHEKIRYERLVKQMHEGNICSQYLNPPVIVSLSKAEEGVLEKYMEYLNKCGFEVEYFGGNEYSLRAVPVQLWGITADEYFHDLMDLLEREHISEDLSEVLHRIATISCKGAIKGNQKISDREAEVLIDELMTLDEPYHCPHGRPVIIRFTRSDIDKMFKRIV